MGGLNNDEKYCFHFTHLENLESIITNGLLCTNRKNDEGIGHKDIASTSIQARRSKMNVPCGPGGCVHDYVPFYLCSVNPMFLSLLNAKNIDQQMIIFFVLSIKYVEKNHVVFTDASANTAEPPGFYSQSADLDKLNWNAILKTSWAKGEPNELHSRMAEVLVRDKVSMADVDHIVVWNDAAKTEVQKLFTKHNEKCPDIVFTSSNDRYPLYFTKFFFSNRKNETLVTGPLQLHALYKKTYEDVIKERANAVRFTWSGIEDLLGAIRSNFSTLPELDGIHGLEVVNEVHSENVSDHTLLVVSRLVKSKCFAKFNQEDRQVLELAAYLHDIGKGPRAKWKSGKQGVYPDHPVDGLRMVKRILVEEIEELSDDQIKIICLLVAYHDLIGEIIGKGREIEQLSNVVKTERELDMLLCLNRADIDAIGVFSWICSYWMRSGQIKNKVMKKIVGND